MPTIDQDLGKLAIEVAWRFEQYGSYGRQRASALRALRRRASGFDARQCERAFDAASRLWPDCIEIVKANRSWINSRGNTDPRPFRRLLKAQTRRFGAAVVEQAVLMVIFWFHLK